MAVLDDDDGDRQKYSTNFRNGYLSPVPAACKLSVKVVLKERNNGNYDKVEDSGLRQKGSTAMVTMTRKKLLISDDISVLITVLVQERASSAPAASL